MNTVPYLTPKTKYKSKTSNAEVHPMTSEQKLLSQWRELPAEKQEEVIDFVAFLAQRTAKNQAAPQSRDRFQQLRDQIVASGIPLLSEAEIDQEVADRRGGHQEIAS